MRLRRQGLGARLAVALAWGAPVAILGVRAIVVGAGTNGALQEVGVAMLVIAAAVAVGVLVVRQDVVRIVTGDGRLRVERRHNRRMTRTDMSAGRASRVAVVTTTTPQPDHCGGDEHHHHVRVDGRLVARHLPDEAAAEQLRDLLVLELGGVFASPADGPSRV